MKIALETIRPDVLASITGGDATAAQARALQNDTEERKGSCLKMLEDANQGPHGVAAGFPGMCADLYGNVKAGQIPFRGPDGIWRGNAVGK